MLPASARRRRKAANGFLESLIDPIDWLSETIFSILIIGLKREDLTVALGRVIVAILAVVPSTIPFLVLQHDFALALRISIIVSFAMLFIAGFRWGSYTGASPWENRPADVCRNDSGVDCHPSRRLDKGN